MLPTVFSVTLKLEILVGVALGMDCVTLRYISRDWNIGTSPVTDDWAMLVRVLAEPEIDLFASVCAPLSVTSEEGKVLDPDERSLFVRVWELVVPTTAPVAPCAAVASSCARDR